MADKKNRPEATQPETAPELQPQDAGTSAPQDQPSNAGKAPRQVAQPAAAMAICPLEYPSLEQAAQAAKNLLARFRGDASVDLACAINCGWIVQGYGLSLGFPHHHPVMMQHSNQDPEQLLEPHLVALAQMSATEEVEGGRQRMQAAAIPWDIIIPAVFSLIQQWLARRS